MRPLAIGMVACLLAAAPAWAAKKEKAAEKKPAAAAAEKEEQPVSRFSWELSGSLPANAKTVRCRAIRTEQQWLSFRDQLGARDFPVDFTKNMLLLCAVRKDAGSKISFMTRPEAGPDRLEAAVAVEGIAPKPQPPVEEGQAPPQVPPAPMRFHLIETPQYAGPVRVSFKVVGPHDETAFVPMDLPAAGP